MMNPNDDELNDEGLTGLFAAYRESCPSLEASVNFQPALWKRIEDGRGFVFLFQKFARSFVTASAAICLLLIGLNLIPDHTNLLKISTYADALAADNTPERTFYKEAINSIPPAEKIFEQQR